MTLPMYLAIVNRTAIAYCPSLFDAKCMCELYCRAPAVVLNLFAMNPSPGETPLCLAGAGPWQQGPNEADLVMPWRDFHNGWSAVDLDRNLVCRIEQVSWE